MSDVVEQLKQCGVFYEGDDCAGGLIRDKVIAEIDRLRLTGAEREAVEWFSHFGRPQNGPVIGKHAATLRGLLERTQTGEK